MWVDGWAARLRVAVEEAQLRELVAENVLSMGNRTYGRPHIHSWRNPYTGERLGGRVEIGNYCSISDEVHIFTGGNHRMDWVTTFPLRIQLGLEGRWTDGHPGSKGDVVIGHDVWIAHGATILSGSTIGTGAVIGAGAVVAGEVPPYAVMAGNPAREIRKRFSQERIDRLIATGWWDWPDDKVKEFVPLLSNADVDAFLDRAEGS